ncbi:hypothetical protein D9615_003554 [Tricholomella constricta]|uniref:Uncharacterized protein n=1 Tax=Tricholomella constricta TaxID=117010 RepID=A0A8H5HHS8_9AGAR|nr:hypothetical protein D9615_003554 [Tricholomella constricta]
MQPPATRKLSTRRGSTAASDPLGHHAHLNRPLQSSSTLTIVRVTSPPPQPEHAAAPSSPRRVHRRLPSQPSVGTSPENPNRLSFAFSSFAPGPAPGGPATIPSPSSSPRLRPSSPHRLSAALPPSKPRLAPEQLLDLARSSTHPRYLPPHLHQPSSPSHSPQLRPQSPSSAHTPSPNTAHATFTPLPDHILLPFIDRPSEVAALISSPPSAKLFSLLAQTFLPTNAADAPPSADPEKWSYAQLREHLTQVTRQQSPDVIWVLQARRCIMTHSELIWERVKGALGVPPDLDFVFDPFALDSHQEDLSSSRSTSSIDTDELSDDHGRAARGHWEDWDAVMDSPIYDRRHQSGQTSPVQPFSLSKHLEERLHGVHSEARGSEEAGDVTIAPTPVRRGSGTFSPLHLVEQYSGSNPGSRAVSPSSFLSIEPLLVPTAPSPTHVSPPSSISGHASLATSEIIGLGLDDIQEGAEEEEEPTSATTASSTDKTTKAGESSHPEENEEQNDPDLIAPSQIQGLRISTVPVAVSEPSISAPRLPTSTVTPTTSSLSATTSYIAPSPISPLPPYPNPNAGQGNGVRSRPVSGSFTRPYSYAPSVFRRSGSFGSLGSLRGDNHHREDMDESSSESGALGDRVPGSPLFPSNFARLNAEPTLGGHAHAHHGDHGQGQGVQFAQKKRAYSHGAAAGSGGSVSGYKRLSWGAAPAQQPPAPPVSGDA